MKSRLFRRPARHFAVGTAAVIAITAAAVSLSGFEAGAQTGGNQASTTGPPPGSGWIRFGHFATTTGPVSVAVDGRVVSASASFETVTPYQSEPAGTHVVTVTPHGTSSAPLSVTVTVTSGQADTVAALPGPNGPALTWFTDNLSAAPAGDAKVRVVDAVPAQKTLAARFDPAGATDTSSVQSASSANPTDQATFGSASPYSAIPAGTYDVQVEGASGMTVVNGRNWPVAAGTVATLVVLQSTSGPTLEAVSDAAGSATAPSGGMQTGYGGEAAVVSAVTPNRNLTGWVAGAAAASLLAAAVLIVLRRGRSGLAALVASLALLGAALVLRPSTATGPPRPLASGTSVKAQGSPERPTVGRSSLQPATVSLAATATTQAVPPTELYIPEIGVRTAVMPLGRNPDGTAQVPPTTTVAGWYDDGPIPGQTGPAVILGHVDSTRGPGVFFQVRDLQPGAKILVGEGSTTITFAVQSVATYGKSDFPTDAVFGPVPDRALRLITCGGPFDSQTGHYLDNVVVYATETS